MTVAAGRSRFRQNKAQAETIIQAVKRRPCTRRLYGTENLNLAKYSALPLKNKASVEVEIRFNNTAAERAVPSENGGPPVSERASKTAKPRHTRSESIITALSTRRRYKTIFPCRSIPPKGRIRLE